MALLNMFAEPASRERPFLIWQELGSEASVKEAGKYRTEGKNYVVVDGDIIFFKFNVTTDAKKK